MKQFMHLLFLTLLLSACEPWLPEEFPVKVDIDSSLSDEQAEATLEACERWNEAVGMPVFKPVAGNGRRIQRNRIHITADASPDEGMLATAYRNVWHCEIRAKGLQKDVVNTIVHELGHCIGLEHDHDDRRSIMFEGYAPDQAIMPHHIEHVRQLMH